MALSSFYNCAARPTSSANSNSQTKLILGSKEIYQLPPRFRLFRGVGTWSNQQSHLSLPQLLALILITEPSQMFLRPSSLASSVSAIFLSLLIYWSYPKQLIMKQISLPISRSADVDGSRTTALFVVYLSPFVLTPSLRQIIPSIYGSTRIWIKSLRKRICCGRRTSFNLI